MHPRPRLRRLALVSSLLLASLAAGPFVRSAQAGGGAAGPEGPHDSAWLTSKKEAFDRAKREKKLVIVDAFASWCGWCKRLDKDVLDTPRFIEATRKDYVLVRLNTEDGKDGSDYARKFQIANLPTTLVLDGDETVVGRIAGYVKFEEFVGHLDNFRKSYREMRTRDEQARGAKGDDVTFVLQTAAEWEARGEIRRSGELYGRAADSKKATPEQKARAAYAAAASGLRQGNVAEAEKRLRQLDRISPLPPDMNGFPEILRSDIAALRGDLDFAIKILEELMATGDPNAGWRQSIPNRINELKNNLRYRELQQQQQKGASPRPQG